MRAPRRAVAAGVASDFKLPPDTRSKLESSLQASKRSAEANEVSEITGKQSDLMRTRRSEAGTFDEMFLATAERVSML